MSVSSFYYNEEDQMAVVVLDNGDQYSFESYDNMDELDGIVDQFIYDEEKSVNKYSPNDSDEFVESFDGDEWEDITHVYVSLKFTTGGYKPKHVG